VNAPALNAISQLADEMKLHWAVLHTAVRLDRTWHPNLKVPYTEAEQDALRLGRRLAGGARRVDTLADLRVFCMDQIRVALERMTESLQALPVNDPPSDGVRQAITDVTEIAKLLLAGVDVRCCSCTDSWSARHLTRRLSELGGNRLVDAADALVRLACAEAERLLTEVSIACRAGGAQQPDVVRAVH
jgi:hypothetical protein